MTSQPDAYEPLDDALSRPVYENPGSASGRTRCSAPTACRASMAWSSSRTGPSASCPSTTTGRVWLVGQYRYPLDAYSWEIPEGGGPESETPEETAHRELREETGLTAGRLELVATSHLSNSVSDELAYLFRATELTEGARRARGNRAARGPPLRMGRGLGDAPTRRDHRLDERDRSAARGRPTPRGVGELSRQ